MVTLAQLKHTCICNGSLHRDDECIAQYSRWLNVHGKLSDFEHSEIKNTIMFSTSTVVVKKVEHGQLTPSRENTHSYIHSFISHTCSIGSVCQCI